jgi:hypothetical protein
MIKTISLALGALLLCGTAAQAAPVSGQGTWESTLQARDLDGNGTTDAFYDTELNVTWLGYVKSSGITQVQAKTWASNLVVSGYSGWRLPFVIDTGAPGCDLSFAGGTDCGYNVQTKTGSTVYSEMAHLYYITLGNKAYCRPGETTCSTAQSGWGLTNTGDFLNLQSGNLWTGTSYDKDNNYAWSFSTLSGSQLQGDVANLSFFSMAVRPGDVTAIAAIPEPETYALMLGGLAALALVQRRRKSGASKR